MLQSRLCRPRPRPRPRPHDNKKKATMKTTKMTKMTVMPPPSLVSFSVAGPWLWPRPQHRWKYVLKYPDESCQISGWTEISIGDEKYSMPESVSSPSSDNEEELGPGCVEFSKWVWPEKVFVNPQHMAMAVWSSETTAKQSKATWRIYGKGNRVATQETNSSRYGLRPSIKHNFCFDVTWKSFKLWVNF